MEYFTRSHVEQVDLGLLAFFVKIERLQGYLQSMPAVALIYDTLLTMDRETKYFWKVPRKPVDFIYFATRYIGILGAVAILSNFSLSADLEECNFSLWIRQIGNWLTINLTDYILTIRVLALYSRDRTLSICLYLFLTVDAVVKLAILSYATTFEHVVLIGAGRVTICGEEGRPPWWLGIIDWSVQLAYGVILMAVALYKAAEYWRMSAGFKGFLLVKVLIEDQAIYFVAVILVSVFSMLEFRLARSNIIAVYILQALGSPSFLCILGSRMLLNLKEAGERGQNEGTSFNPPSRTVSDMEFGEPPANVEASQTEAAHGE